MAKQARNYTFMHVDDTDTRIEYNRERGALRFEDVGTIFISDEQRADLIAALMTEQETQDYARGVRSRQKVDKRPARA